MINLLIIHDFPAPSSPTIIIRTRKGLQINKDDKFDYERSTQYYFKLQGKRHKWQSVILKIPDKRKK